jgi:hypothetical protein
MEGMFARLSRKSARWLDVRVEHALSGNDNGMVSLFQGFCRRHLNWRTPHIQSVDVNVLTCLDLSWRGLCGQTIEPVYRGLKNVVEEDLDTVARLLSELDPLGEEQVRRAPVSADYVVKLEQICRRMKN